MPVVLHLSRLEQKNQRFRLVGLHNKLRAILSYILGPVSKKKKFQPALFNLPFQYLLKGPQ